MKTFILILFILSFSSIATADITAVDCIEWSQESNEKLDDPLSASDSGEDGDDIVVFYSPQPAEDTLPIFWLVGGPLYEEANLCVEKRPPQMG